MRQSTDNFADAMSQLDKPAGGTDRLDQVAEMVSQMEQRLSNQINEANKQLIDKMQRGQPDPSPEPEPEPIPEEDAIIESDEEKGE